ncbi:uncharacterized protein RJT20DRAFT_3397 [Scheffersomyces xylosifermentans]|uniref:uncharacterized protein n=1 Tax=Scheffersomyces xylosifermentans TaxID=1304137 RepID=UPI00315C4F2E
MKAQAKDAAPESEEQKFKQKCKELKKRINEIEGSNAIATLALTRTKAAIRRLRLEYVILLERLEERAILLPEGIGGFEEMASPPTPSVLDESLNSVGGKLLRNGLSKKGTKKAKSNASSSDLSSASQRSQKVRDPDLPKRPTNAYLIFFEKEKERVKQENEEKNPGSAIDLTNSMREAWKNLDDESRKPYYKLYEDDRIRYQREMVVYNQKKSGTEDVEDKRPTKKQKLEKSDSPEDSPALSISVKKEDEIEKDGDEEVTQEAQELEQKLENEPEPNSPITESQENNSEVMSLPETGEDNSTSEPGIEDFKEIEDD